MEQAADLFSDTIISDDGKEGFDSFKKENLPGEILNDHNYLKEY